MTRERLGRWGGGSRSTGITFHWCLVNLRDMPSCFLIPKHSSFPHPCPPPHSPQLSFHGTVRQEAPHTDTSNCTCITCYFLEIEKLETVAFNAETAPTANHFQRFRSVCALGCGACWCTLGAGIRLLNRISHHRPP